MQIRSKPLPYSSTENFACVHFFWEKEHGLCIEIVFNTYNLVKGR